MCILLSFRRINQDSQFLRKIRHGNSKVSSLHSKTLESCQGESCPTWDMDPIPRRNKTLHHIKSASNYLGVNSKGVFLSQWQLLKTTVKEILHSGWCFIHQDHDHHTFSDARGTAKVIFLRTTAAPPKRKHSHGI